MDNRGDRFASGFLAGTIFGSIVGSVLGVLLASKITETGTEQTAAGSPPGDRKPKRHRRSVLKTPPAPELNLEEAQQGLETKIAQLNSAIDDVRRQLSNVNGNSQE